MHERKWIFPKRPCPRCSSHDSEPTHTDSVRGVQYRRCRVAVCRYRFSVNGDPIAAPAALKCPHCEKTYKRQADLTKHIKRNHGHGENDGQG